MNSNRPPDRVGAVFAALGKSACYVGLFIGMQVAVMFLAAVVLGAVAGIRQAITGQQPDADGFYRLLMDNTMVFSLISGLLTIAVVLAFYLIRRKKLDEALMLRPVGGSALLTAASLVPALYVIVVVVLTFLPEAWMEGYNEASASVDTRSLVGVFAVVAVAPVVEEFIFRGLVMNRLSRVMPGWLAVVLSAVVFGLCHGNVVWFCYTFVLGAFFGFVDLRTGSIWPSILSHVVFNAIGQIFTFIPEEGAWPALGVLALAGIVLPVLNRKAVAALLRPAPKPLLEQIMELPAEPGIYDYDPWDE